MTKGLGYAPTAGKAKTIATPDANKNNRSAPVNKDKKIQILLKEQELLDHKNQ